MSSSVSHPGPVMHDFGDSPEEDRLRGLTRQQLADRLNWLSWWSPGTFQAVMDYMDFVDNLAADGHPSQDNPDDLAPYCLACGSEIGRLAPRHPCGGLVVPSVPFQVAVTR
jgi:hypothetical protein